MLSNRRILISGAGISGLTLAYWLQQYGFSPTIVEKRADLQARGYMIDFYGSGYDVADKMGLIEALRVKSEVNPIHELVFVDDNGKPRARLDVDKFRELLNHRYFPLMRGDIESTIYESVHSSLPLKLGTTITKIEAHADGVAVELSNGVSENFDLVIGADGIHSNVRRLVWGPESQFRRFLGFYIACSVIENKFGVAQSALGHFEPNLQASVYSIGNHQLATFFAFRSTETLEARTRSEQLDILTKRLEGLGWLTPQLLEETKKAKDFFFDVAAQIDMETWHCGRVALVGDACQCLTLLAGQGASLGMAGAYVLAEELYKADGNYDIAFPAYQQRLKPEIERRQKEARGLAGTFVPRNRFEIALAHFFFSVAFWPGFRTLFANQIGARSLIK